MMAQKVCLGDVADFVNGAAFKPEDWGDDGHPIIRIQNLTDRSKPFNRTRRSVNEKLYVHPGDLLVSWSATLGVFEWDRAETGVLNQHIFRVIPDASKIEKAYLRHAVAVALLDMQKHLHGATMQHVNRGEFLSTPLHLPPLPEQRRIAAILDQTDALRAKRREALAQLDSLTQSIFIEMFGEPSTNPRSWPSATLGDCIYSASDGPHVSPTYSETGIPFISTRHVRPGEISWGDLKYLAKSDAEVQWRKCRPQRGDILYTKGGTTGLAAAVRTDTPFAVWVHVALLKPDPAKVETEWLESMLNSEFCYRQSQDLTYGIANRDLGLKRMTKIEMYIPPTRMQREFVERKERVNSIRASGRLALTELDALFASLQHRAFAGQLS